MSELEFDRKLAELVEAALREDVGDGDHSTLSCIPAKQEGEAVLKVKETGILAGMRAAEKIFKMVEPSASFVGYKQDGERMVPGEIAFEVVHNLGRNTRPVN